VFGADRERREAAASTIQHTWRKRRAIAKQEHFQRENEDTIVGLQSALKAHLVRKRMISLQGSSPAHGNQEEVDAGHESADSFEDIEVIQSAVRGHFTRQMALQDLRQIRYIIILD